MKNGHFHLYIEIIYSRQKLFERFKLENIFVIWLIEWLALKQTTANFIYIKRNEQIDIDNSND